MEDILSDFGINLLEEEIDDVIFETNQFLTSPSFMSQGGPFYIILQISMALGAIFAFIMACQMGYKMLLKNEPLDVLKLFRPLAVAIIMCWWYPPSQTGLISSSVSWSVLDFLSFIPNAFGSYTHELYNAEAEEISDKFEQTQKLIYQRDTLYQKMASDVEAAKKAGENSSLFQAVLDAYSVNELAEIESDQSKLWITSLTAGITIMIDKIVMAIALVVYRIGWWATIYCQQILLGMLTIFGPIQWAFSLLPKWEGVWAKWIIRYLTVHFYGAMLYFVGFYVLLLFDIVLSIQIENLSSIVESQETMAAYLQNAFFTAIYILAASIVSLRCLNLVPDLAAWMIPEGDTAFSTRNFGEGVAYQVRASANSVLRGNIMGAL